MSLNLLTLCVLSLLCGVYGQTPQVQIFPRTIEGQEGENVTFVCDHVIVSDPGAIVLEVFVPVNNRFESFSFPNERAVRVPDGSAVNYTFGPLLQSDNNTMFRCSGLSQFDISEVATISVIFPPNITRQSPDGDPLRFREGESLSVLLNVSANPRPDQYVWTQNGGLARSENGRTVALESITFDPLSREHDGVYVLNASNSAGFRTYTFTLDVLYPPEFPDSAVTPDTINCTREGATYMCAAYPGTPIVRFNCSADGNPTPNLTTSDSGVENTNTVDYVTTISNVVDDHAGTYYCSATSSEFPQDDATRTFRFYVGGRAAPLLGVGIVNAGNNTITANWTYDNSVNRVPATDFIATITQGGVQIGNPIERSANFRNATVSTRNLTVGQTYTVSVVVRNLQGDSDAISATFVFNSAIGVSISYSLSLLLVVYVMFTFV